MIPFMASDPKYDREHGGGDDTPVSPTRGLHVMIVEYEPVLARNLARSLERMGHSVECMEEGEAALRRVQEQRPDLILLDNRLPGISGLETLQRLRDHDPSLLVIMMTAFATLDDAVTAMRLGAADFVRKPIGLAELELAIERVVQNDRLRQELRYYRRQREGRSQSGLVGESEVMAQLRHTIERLRVTGRQGQEAKGDVAGGGHGGNMARIWRTGCGGAESTPPSTRGGCDCIQGSVRLPHCCAGRTDPVFRTAQRSDWSPSRFGDSEGHSGVNSPQAGNPLSASRCRFAPRTLVVSARLSRAFSSPAHSGRVGPC